MIHVHILVTDRPSFIDKRVDFIIDTSEQPVWSMHALISHPYNFLMSAGSHF